MMLQALPQPSPGDDEATTPLVLQRAERRRFADTVVRQACRQVVSGEDVDVAVLAAGELVRCRAPR